MTKSGSIQYYTAAVLGFVFLAAQLIMLKTQVGAGFQIERHQLMFWQVASVILNDINLSLQVLAYITLALLSHIGLPLFALLFYRTALSDFIPGKAEKYGLPFVILTLLLAAMWNRKLHPMSRAYEYVELLMLQPLSPILFWVGTVLIGLIVLIAAIKITLRFQRAALIIVVVLSSMALTQPLPADVDRNRSHPDVIILGVDSLRPDFVHGYGFPKDDLTPTLNSLLEEMVVIDGAITPLARTFVSYMSLLTGRNPTKHGVRFNLFPWDQIEDQKSISRKLGELDYKRVLAMDESRFANFPPLLEFDELVVPRVGGLDFVIGSSYDLAVTNLILAIPYIGSQIDYVFGNRAAYRTYSPSHHVQKVLREIEKIPQVNPAFFVSHLCLPHWPYLKGNLWEEDDLHSYRDLEGFEDVPVSYFRALAAADDQLSSILDRLRESGRLEHALVILISDHGESFGLERDKINNLDSGTSLMTYGHGGFVVSIEQNSIALGMQYYRSGIKQWEPRKEHADVSIIDLAPTIEALVFGKATGYEGKSLLSLLSLESNEFAGRPRFYESGIRSSGVERPDVDEKIVADEMSYLYRVTSDLRFEVRPEQIPSQLNIKQRAVILDGLVVAAMPKAFEGGYGDCWAVLDIPTKALNCDSYPSASPRVYHLQEMVCQYYRDDPKFSHRWCNADQPSAPNAETNELRS